MNRYIDETLRVLEEGSNLRSLKSVDKTLINLSSNDYLGVAANSELKALFHRSVDVEKLSYGAASSRLLTGNHSSYSKLESTLASLYGSEDALVFNSGYHAGVGLMPAVVGRGDLVIADKLIHASIIDGIKISGAALWRYPHLDYDKLDSYLSKHRDSYSRVVIATESIFSMDGDCADLVKLSEIKSKYGAVLYVDEAHSVGVEGVNGLGLSHKQGVFDQVDLFVGTFGKAFASVGAYVICSSKMKSYLVNRTRSLIFTTALPEINIAWSNFIIEQDLSEYRDRLRGYVEELSVQSHIFPIIIGSNGNAIKASEQFAEQNILVMPVRYPTVPKGSARLRFSLSASLREEDIRKLKYEIDSIF